MIKQTLTQWLVKKYGNELRDLYLNKMFTERELAKYFKVSRHPIRDAMAILEIPKRHNRGLLYYHPGRKPTKEQLDKWLNQDLETLHSIANKLECDPSSIRNWAIEYSIDWDKTPWRRAMNRAQPIQITQRRLEDLYLKQHLGLQQIADIFKCSRGYITKLMKEHRIPLRLPGWKAKWFKCNDGHQVRSTYERRVDNWLFGYGLLHTYEPSLLFDPLLTGDFLVGQTYIEVWGVYDNAAYKERKKRKRNLYAEHNLALIEIGYWDFAARAKDRWQRKLSMLLLKG